MWRLDLPLAQEQCKTFVADSLAKDEAAEKERTQRQLVEEAARTARINRELAREDQQEAARVAERQANAARRATEAAERQAKRQQREVRVAVGESSQFVWFLQKLESDADLEIEAVENEHNQKIDGATTAAEAQWIKLPLSEQELARVCFDARESLTSSLCACL